MQQAKTKTYKQTNRQKGRLTNRQIDIQTENNEANKKRLFLQWYLEI